MLPETVPQLHASWDVMAKLEDTLVWDFLWDSKVDENREKGLLQTAFTANHDDMPMISDGSGGCQELRVAEAALKVRRRPSSWIPGTKANNKMVFGTPGEDYVPSRGAALLRSAGKGMASRAKDGLLGRGFLSKLVKGSQRHKPGRTLKISEMWLVLVNIVGVFGCLTVRSETRMPSVAQYHKNCFMKQRHWMPCMDSKRLGGSGHCGHLMAIWPCYYK
jgi:hypothetical protein